MQGVAGNIGLINPLVFNHFGYGTYAQVRSSEGERETECVKTEEGVIRHCVMSQTKLTLRQKLVKSEGGM